MLSNTKVKLEILFEAVQIYLHDNSKKDYDRTLYDVSMEICRDYPDSVRKIYQGNIPKGADLEAINEITDIYEVTDLLAHSFDCVSVGDKGAALYWAKAKLKQLQEDRNLEVLILS